MMAQATIRTRRSGLGSAASAAERNYALVVLINQTGYRLNPMKTEASAAQRSFELLKSDGTAYHVSQFGYGCECTCPDFIYRRDGIDPMGCKHIKALRACQMLEAGRGFPA